MLMLGGSASIVATLIVVMRCMFGWASLVGSVWMWLLWYVLVEP